MIMSFAAAGTRLEKSGMDLLVINVVGNCDSRSIRSMHISDSEKLDSDRVGRTVGRSAVYAYD